MRTVLAADWTLCSGGPSGSELRHLLRHRLVRNTHHMLHSQTYRHFVTWLERAQDALLKFQASQNRQFHVDACSWKVSQRSPVSSVRSPGAQSSLEVWADSWRSPAFQEVPWAARRRSSQPQRGALPSQHHCCAPRQMSGLTQSALHRTMRNSLCIFQTGAT